MKPLTSFGFYGGKARLSGLISSMLDYGCETYLEPFGGSAAVLLNKQPHDREICGETSVGLYCFWRIMSESETFERLIERLYDTSYNFEEFQGYRRSLNGFEEIRNEDTRKILCLKPNDQLNAAVSTFVVFTQSRDNAGEHWSDNRFASHESYLTNIDRLADVADRFNGVQVVYTPKDKLFPGNAGTLPGAVLLQDARNNFYFDPPYIAEAGKEKDCDKPGSYYRYDWGIEEHRDFLRKIRRAEAKVLVSNYDDVNHLYARYLEHGEGFAPSEMNRFSPWERIEVEAKSTVARGDRGRVECFWRNY
ncbi:DNA methyltransferase [Clostridia bacterium]|nr:DNA methyltransferase [Clostridia bacterium]